MRADKIKTIIGNINDLPYKTILFDGTWGVGKSYAVNEALAGNPDVCKQMRDKYIMKYCFNWH